MGGTSVIDTDAVEAVGRKADERTDELASGRELPSDIATELAATGLCRSLSPRELGAPEIDMLEFIDCLERLAYHDGATSWCAMISATTSLLGGHFQGPWAETIFGDPASITGGHAAPQGTAQIVDGGLLVNGSWQWGSGLANCTYAMGGCRIVDGEGEPARLPDGTGFGFVFFEPGQLNRADNWHVSGMEGTGSADYSVTDAFVPEGRLAAIGAEPLYDRPLYRFPFLGALAIGVASVSLGLARRAFDEFIELASTKSSAGSSRTLAERQVTQLQVSEAEAAFRSARAFLSSAASDAWASAERGAMDDAERRQIRLAATNATAQSAKAVDLCYHAAGGTSVYKTSVLQRVFRDVHVTTQHAMVSPRMYEVLGRATLGLPTDLRQI